VRVVFDTNVLIAAFVSRGHCHELFEYAARTHELLTSDFIIGEFREKLISKLRMEPALVGDAVNLLADRMQRVDPSSVEAPRCSDPEDELVLAMALAAHADCLVTGDVELQEMGQIDGVAIISPRSFWAYEAERTNR
jgi:uncharacterized protein